ncbi:hypothetical protein BFJ70_g10001 [Fusarium oxysporum]|nr:hypothetical protein BFJ70_g10001 [Fusarium oxysporum]
MQWGGRRGGNLIASITSKGDESCLVADRDTGSGSLHILRWVTNCLQEEHDNP